jgi:hypothetical protein
MSKVRYRLEVDLITDDDDDVSFKDEAAKGAADVLNAFLDADGIKEGLRFVVDSAKFTYVGIENG